MTGRRAAITGIALLAGTGLALLLAGAFAPTAMVPRGWLIAFAAWSSVPVGSMTLLLVHRLTGGAWGEALAPVLRPAAALMPLVALAFLPMLLMLPAIYPWAADPTSAPADVARLYLNAPAYALRAGIALLGWCFFAVVAAAGAGGRLFAGLGLAFHGFVISLVAVDWYLSIEPRYTATAFAAMIAIQQILAALAFAALLRPPALAGRVAGDVGGLIIASLLGVVYLESMTYVVAWYGDLPDKAVWYLKRSHPGWTIAIVAALLVGALVPFGLLLKQAVRRSPRGLQWAGLLVLVGSLLHIAWLIGPAFDGLAPLLAAVAAFAGLTAGSMLLAAALPTSERAHAG